MSDAADLPLSLSTAEDMADELARRGWACVITTNEPRGDDGDAHSLIRRGGLMVAIGLTQYARDRFLRDAHSDPTEYESHE